jgi:hypothetical protein
MMRKALRIGLVLFLGVTSGMIVVLVVSVVAAGPEWTRERMGEIVELRFEEISEQFNRRTRCIGVDRPLLTQVSDPWQIEYSWTGGYGGGDIHFLLASDGHGTFTFANGREVQSPITAQLAPDRVSAIAATIDETGFLCLEPIARENHHIVDLGRFSIHVRTGEYQKEVFAGGCYYIPDPEPFEIVSEALDGFADVFGKELKRGPFGTTTLEGPCGE